MLLVVFDAPAVLSHAFRENGFKPYGRQRGAWCREFVDPRADEARDLEYELAGVGLRPGWWQPKVDGDEQQRRADV